MRIATLISILLIGCRPSVKHFVFVDSDTAIVSKSDSLHQFAKDMLPKSEKVIVKVRHEIKTQIKEIKEAVDSLKKENEVLKSTILITKNTVIHDTIYIKEKTNFWGKKKVSIDSASSVSEDSTIIEKK